MRIISSLTPLPWEGCVLTMGDFDGIHRGHRKLIEKTVQQAKADGLASVLLTYEPSPKKVLGRYEYDGTLYTKAEKIMILQNFPLEAVIFLPFDEKIAKITAKDFLQKILLDQLKTRRIIIGYDHKFGRNRRGNHRYLKLAQNRYHFEVKLIKVVKRFNKAASSSLIKDLLRAGKVKAAAELLGAPYFILGTVIHGKQRGRRLGVPTANLKVPADKLIPKKGVYFCMARFDSRTFKAVVNIGQNPTFENTDLSIEAHLLDFDMDIYDEPLTLFFMKRLRDEEKFSGLGELKQQINKDIQYAKRLSVPPSKKIKLPGEAAQGCS